MPSPTQERPPAPEPEESESPVIVLRQEGGIAGVENGWTIYGDGRIVTNSGDEIQVEPEEVTEALVTIEQTGFFNLEQREPSDICCDFFTYTLLVRSDDSENIVVISEGDPNIPRALSEALAAVQDLILSATE